MSCNPVAYATDEDVALRASADFSLLCPKDQKLAAGADGIFAANDPWTLISGTVDFQACGVVPGQVVLLTKPVCPFKPPGEALVVVSTAPGAVTLRRRGLPPGVGQPPAPATGLSPVEFSITTLGPQIARASEDLNRRYGIDDLVAGRRTCDLYNPTEVRDATVLTVLYQQYLDMSRGSSERPDVFSSKAQVMRDELRELLDRVVVHWRTAPAAAASAAPTTRLSTRVSR